MKKLVLFMAVVAFTAGTITTTFGQTPDKGAVKARETLKEEKKDVVVAKQDLKNAKADSISDYKKLTQEANIKIKSNEKRIADLRAAITKSNSKAQEADQKKVTLLENKNNNLKKELSDYKALGQKEFNTFRTGFNRDLGDLDKELKDFMVL